MYPSLIASLRVMEAIKLLVGFGELLMGKILYANGELMEFMITAVQKDKSCRACGGGNI